MPAKAKTFLETPTNGTFVALDLIEEATDFDPDLTEDAACHAPFRVAFLEWFEETSKRFAQQVTIQAISPSVTMLSVPGLHPALGIELSSDSQINVCVTWKNEFWDILSCHDVFAEPDEGGWHDPTLVPEAQTTYSTREACWRNVGFEGLLRWFDDELAPARRLALYRGEGRTGFYYVQSYRCNG